MRQRFAATGRAGLAARAGRRSVGSMKDDMRPESHDADYDQVNPNDIVEYPHHRAAQLSQADEGTIFEFDETEKVFVPKSAFGMTAERVEALRERKVRLGETPSRPRRGAARAGACRGRTARSDAP